MTRSLAIMLALVMLAVVACGASESSGDTDGQAPYGSDVATDVRPMPPQCIPGAQIACACLGGSQGVQLCFRDGTYSDCDCPTVDAGDAGDAGALADVLDARDAPSPDAGPIINPTPGKGDPYASCVIRTSTGDPCREGTRCVPTAAPVEAPWRVCTTYCEDARSCYGHDLDPSRVACVNVVAGARSQCMRRCASQGDCAALRLRCVTFRDSAGSSLSACAP